MAGVLSLALVAGSGCATSRQTEQLGGFVIGAITGGIVAALVDSGADTIAIGAAGGGLLGWGIAAAFQYRAYAAADTDQPEIRIATQSWDGGPGTEIVESSVSPPTVAPGNAVSLATAYRVHATDAAVVVDERWVVRRDGIEVGVVDVSGIEREPGRWIAAPAFAVPADAIPGRYTVEHSVAVGSRFDTSTSTFVVAG